MDFDQSSGRRGRRARSRGEASAPGVRSLRLERVFAEELSWLLRNEVFDELFAFADVARVELSTDLRRAHVVVSLPADHPAPAEAASEGSAARLARVFRAHIAESLDLKRIPAFRVVVQPREPDEADERDEPSQASQAGQADQANQADQEDDEDDEDDEDEEDVFEGEKGGAR